MDTLFSGLIGYFDWSPTIYLSSGSLDWQKEERSSISFVENFCWNVDRRGTWWQGLCCPRWIKNRMRSRLFLVKITIREECCVMSWYTPWASGLSVIIKSRWWKAKGENCQSLHSSVAVWKVRVLLPRDLTTNPEALSTLLSYDFLFSFHTFSAHGGWSCFLLLAAKEFCLPGTKVDTKFLVPKFSGFSQPSPFSDSRVTPSWQKQNNVHNKPLMQTFSR